MPESSLPPSFRTAGIAALTLLIGLLVGLLLGRQSVAPRPERPDPEDRLAGPLDSRPPPAADLEPRPPAPVPDSGTRSRPEEGEVDAVPGADGRFPPGWVRPNWDQIIRQISESDDPEHIKHSRIRFSEIYRDLGDLVPNANFGVLGLAMPSRLGRQTGSVIARPMSAGIWSRDIGRRAGLAAADTRALEDELWELQAEEMQTEKALLHAILHIADRRFRAGETEECVGYVVKGGKVVIIREQDDPHLSALLQELQEIKDRQSAVVRSYVRERGDEKAFFGESGR